MKKLIIFISLVFSLGLNLQAYKLEFVFPAETDKVALEWLGYINYIPFEEKAGTYSIASIEKIHFNGYPLCVVYHLVPKGHIVVTSIKELVPVKSFSLVSDFDSSSTRYEWSVLEDLRETMGFLFEYRKGEDERVEKAVEENRREWTEVARMDLGRNLAPGRENEQSSGKRKRIKWRNFQGISWQSTVVPPLLRTRWDQDWPYNAQCPEISGQRAAAGCVATAASQVLRYYQWPKRGMKKHSYEWKKVTLTADYRDKYDWQHMPSVSGKYDSQEEEQSVAELCYEMGVAVDMMYGVAGSGAYTRDVAPALKKHFRYKERVEVIYRSPDYMNEEDWFKIFKKEVDRKRPVIFRIRSGSGGHAVVVDGYLIIEKEAGDAVSRKVHVNMGWGGPCDAYYSLDKVYYFRKNESQYAIVKIIPRHALVVYSPSRRQQVEKGKAVRISWSSWGYSSLVRIELYLNKKLIGTIEEETANDGEFLWKVSDHLPSGINYRIRVIDANRPTHDYWGDFFTIN